jgi:hypothetical protein
VPGIVIVTGIGIEIGIRSGAGIEVGMPEIERRKKIVIAADATAEGSGAVLAAVNRAIPSLRAPTMQ